MYTDETHFFVNAGNMKKALAKKGGQREENPGGIEFGTTATFTSTLTSTCEEWTTWEYEDEKEA